MDFTPSTQWCSECEAHRTFNTFNLQGTYGCVVCGFVRNVFLTDQGGRFQRVDRIPDCLYAVLVRTAQTEIVWCTVGARNTDEAGAIVADFFVRVHGWDWRNAQESIVRIVRRGTETTVERTASSLAYWQGEPHPFRGGEDDCKLCELPIKHWVHTHE